MIMMYRLTSAPILLSCRHKGTDVNNFLSMSFLLNSSIYVDLVHAVYVSDCVPMPFLSEIKIPVSKEHKHKATAETK